MCLALTEAAAWLPPERNRPDAKAALSSDHGLLAHTTVLFGRPAPRPSNKPVNKKAGAMTGFFVGELSDLFGRLHRFTGFARCLTSLLHLVASVFYGFSGCLFGRFSGVAGYVCRLVQRRLGVTALFARG
jgi:hypothetical protein